MKEYREGKLRGDVVEEHLQPSNLARRERLKEANRLYTFKWRLSKILGPQYEILLCVQYGPKYGAFKNDKGMVRIHSEELCNDVDIVVNWFPTLKDDGFIDICDAGGGEIFKVFLLGRYNRKFNRYTECLLGVMDKAKLLESLERFPRRSSSKWETIWDKVTSDSRQDTWRKLINSNAYCGWVDNCTMGYLLKCTMRTHPDWNSSKLYNCLYGWTMGIRKIWPVEHYEWREANADDTLPTIFICSPFLWCDESWFNEIA